MPQILKKNRTKTEIFKKFRTKNLIDPIILLVFIKKILQIHCWVRDGDIYVNIIIKNRNRKYINNGGKHI